MMTRILSIAFFMLVLAIPVNAADFRPFGSKSRPLIENELAGKPFILALWSVDCPYCMEDLQALGQLVKQHPELALVTVCTDARETSESAARLLDSLDLPQHGRWQFAERDDERLRYNIDKNWYGELPRTYFYNARHEVKALSGKPDPLVLDAWGAALKPR